MDDATFEQRPEEGEGGTQGARSAKPREPQTLGGGEGRSSQRGRTVSGWSSLSVESKLSLRGNRNRGGNGLGDHSKDLDFHSIPERKKLESLM